MNEQSLFIEAMEMHDPAERAAFLDQRCAGDSANSRSRYFEKRKDVAGCRRTAELWENLHRTDARRLYNCACYRAVAAKVIRATDRSSAGAKEFEAEANRAMVWLQRAVAAGYNKADKIKGDADLDALSDRADFRQLVSQLEAAAAVQKK